MAKKKITRKQLFWLFLAGWVVLSLVLSILSFSAMNDIHKDYVSSEAHIRALLKTGELPDWTLCRGEWLVVRLDFFLRIIFLGGLVFFSIRWLRNKKDQK